MILAHIYYGVLLVFYVNQVAQDNLFIKRKAILLTF